MIRPTARAVALLAAGLPLSIVLVLIEPALWVAAVAYLGVAVVLIAGDARLALPASAVGIALSPPRELYVGEPATLTVTVTAPRPLAVELLLDGSDDLAPSPPVVCLVGAGGRGTATTPLLARRRGTVTLTRVWLRWTGRLGLAARTRSDPLGTKLPVLPNIAAVRRSALLAYSRNPLIGERAMEQQGEGSEFEALRDYVAGLDHRAIEWKQSARHRRLVCKQFRAERNHSIVLAFDTGHLMAEPIGGVPKLDHGITGGLVLGYHALAGGDRVGLYGFDATARAFHEPRGGVASFRYLLLAAADLAYNRNETNFTLGLAELTTRLRRRSLVILLTDFVDTITAELMIENVERLARRHLVVFATLRDPALEATVEAAPRSLDDVARAVLSDDLLRERRIVLERLGRLGVQCLDAPADGLGVDLLNRYLVIKRRELV